MSKQEKLLWYCQECECAFTEKEIMEDKNYRIMFKNNKGKRCIHCGASNFQKFVKEDLSGKLSAVKKDFQNLKIRWGLLNRDDKTISRGTYHIIDDKSMVFPFSIGEEQYKLRIWKEQQKIQENQCCYNCKFNPINHIEGVAICETTEILIKNGLCGLWQRKEGGKIN